MKKKSSARQSTHGLKLSSCGVHAANVFATALQELWRTTSLLHKNEGQGHTAGENHGQEA